MGEKIKNLQQWVGFASRLHPLRTDVLDIGFFRAPQLLLPRRHRTGREAEGIAARGGYSTQDAPDEESKRGQRDEDRSGIKNLGFHEGFRGGGGESEAALGGERGGMLGVLGGPMGGGSFYLGWVGSGRV